VSNKNGVLTSFADLGTQSLTDEQFVDFYNATLPPGLRLMGAKCIRASQGRGELVISFEMDEGLTNVGGFICGGYIAQALDQAATAAATLVTGMAAPSINLTTNFIAPLLPGTVSVTGSVVKSGKSVAFTEARLSRSDGRLMATATVTSQLMAASSLVERRSNAEGRP
jgi:uncharacterized protein (TIGR00369 family)